MPPYAVDIVEPYNLDEEGTDLTILTMLMALLADHVMGVVATTRRGYLTEFNRYLDEQRSDRPKSRKTAA